MNIHKRELEIRGFCVLNSSSLKNATERGLNTELLRVRCRFREIAMHVYSIDKINFNSNMCVNYASVVYKVTMTMMIVFKLA